MKRIFSYALLLVMALSMGLPANAKKKEIAFQMYSVRDLIGDPGKYAKNHESALKQQWDIQLWKLHTMATENCMA